ncbi:hypothetical protein RUM44_008121 [Polyplax serrata]|uniref:Uncharacterized protein n=1 Tax=Polyplax serrata TaxID=468196 RepID=A0ABR1BBD7_POLSC
MERISFADRRICYIIPNTPDFAKQLHTQPTEEVLDKMKVTSEVEEFRQFASENAV